MLRSNQVSPWNAPKRVWYLYMYMFVMLVSVRLASILVVGKGEVDSKFREMFISRRHRIARGGPYLSDLGSVSLVFTEVVAKLHKLLEASLRDYTRSVHHRRRLTTW